MRKRETERAEKDIENAFERRIRWEGGRDRQRKRDEKKERGTKTQWLTINVPDIPLGNSNPHLSRFATYYSANVVQAKT